MASYSATERHDGGGTSLLYDPRVRGIFYQVIVFVAVVGSIYWIVGNTITNLQRANIASGFGFLNGRAGFDVSQTLISYNSDSTYGRAILVGLVNTLYVAGLGVITASIIGFLVGIGRLSRNWLIRKICTVYVEVFRNIPPLLVIFFWYFGILATLPNVRESISGPLHTYINTRGFFMPAPVWGEGAWLILAALALGIVGSFVVARWAKRRQMATGQPFHTIRVAIALIIGLPLLAFIAAGFPVSFDVPKLGTFNLTGGAQVKPEFLALFLALSFYTASFIAETVRAGILGVNKGQTEAAYAVGMRPGPTMRLIIVPQALRIIIPPLSSQYLNLIKNSSLAIAIGYPDLVAVGGTILNQTGQSVEVVAIWMVIYLGISLVTSALMNWFNAKMALVER
ncbi:amino acid ABC transporter permease [Ochrobactrum soli]|uniref:Amino acid ABC transporter permease n=1 Tax=Ochrobactrum soli TaxID=2448455 RepID=A0A849KNJ5_9HYPH|nr:MULTISPECIES: amino acid ABC transporter permease [Brucella]RRD25822.1 amino acid ABC transporter permease [Brucellaceae bacterium VT-16-1752]WHT42770.1 amino acid ABC transporter permease [Ochrobactrum sp. SSR]NNU60149.1 amino acid ABC transporter permease [[Ochrobactrum] soli]RLL76391.1 amino acid ABC transporter permease [[Ochrobactrum] soli]WHS30762.1 amino acid ABC transporter permease [Brucella sp. NM4]